MQREKSRMSITKTKRVTETAARDFMSDWMQHIKQVRKDARTRQETDAQILRMMRSFDDLNDRHLRTLFNAVDIDGNGILDRAEVKRLITKVICMDVADEVVEFAFSEMDFDDSGGVDINEFTRFFGH